MSKRIQAKHKIDRRLGVNLWGRPKSPVNDREYGPGQHGQRRKKPTDYGIQLMAKQRLKGYYGSIGERQFRKLYQEAVRRRGDTSENLIGLLERRLRCSQDLTVVILEFDGGVWGVRGYLGGLGELPLPISPSSLSHEVGRILVELVGRPPFLGDQPRSLLLHQPAGLDCSDRGEAEDLVHPAHPTVVEAALVFR